MLLNTLRIYVSARLRSIGRNRSASRTIRSVRQRLLNAVIVSSLLYYSLSNASFILVSSPYSTKAAVTSALNASYIIVVSVSIGRL